jgi:hypothetical protein
MLKLLRRGLLALNILNCLFGLVWLGMIVSGLYQTSGDLSGGRGAFVLQLVLSLATVALVYLIFRCLALMIADAESGNGLGAHSTGRLYSIGWSLLGVAVLSSRPVPTGTELVIWNALWRLTGDPHPELHPSLTIWLAVPLVFALAAIFREGARMREDLEGTV